MPPSLPDWGPDQPLSGDEEQVEIGPCQPQGESRSGGVRRAAGARSRSAARALEQW